jgi:hypothetical protein
MDLVLHNILALVPEIVVDFRNSLEAAVLADNMVAVAAHNPVVVDHSLVAAGRTPAVPAPELVNRADLRATQCR